jgi:hypothetical protein
MNLMQQASAELFEQIRLAHRLVEYFAIKGYVLDRNPGEVNIIYLEGAHYNGTPISDDPDKWNDRRIVLMFDKDNKPFIAINHAATTEPGRSATMSQAAAKRGGVARIKFGQFRAWRVGYHNQAKNGRTHPALVQRAELWVHRDRNRDGKRTGDPVTKASGINQHSTRPGYTRNSVGTWSEGCLVGWIWEQHMKFMELVQSDPRYLADPNYMFLTTIIDATEFHSAVPPLAPAG